MPVVVVFDDGLGGRILDGITRPAPRRAVRLNAEPSPGAALEPPPLTEYDLLLSPEQPPAIASGAAWVETPDLLPVQTIVEQADAASRRVRATIGAGQERPLVVGWGEDDWVDGPDVFVRALWHLSERHGLDVDALWLDPGTDPHARQRLLDEAERCGLATRYHHLPATEVADRWAGDAILLPYRSPAPPLDVLHAIVAGLPVVTFEPSPLDHRLVAAVPPLDLDGAAGALFEALTGNHDDAVREARERADVAAWVTRFLAAVAERRSP
jgi:hypothetical protein